MMISDLSIFKGALVVSMDATHSIGLILELLWVCPSFVELHRRRSYVDADLPTHAS